MPAAADIPPFILVLGDDDFAVKERSRHLFDQWSKELGGMDHEIIDARVTNGDEAVRALGRLREALQTLPFFGSGKAIWLQGCNFLGKDRVSASKLVTDAVADLALELKSFDWRGVRLVISAGDVDGRRVFYKTAEKVGKVEEFTAWSAEKDDWIAAAEGLARRELAARGQAMSDETLATFVQWVGPHRQQLINEVEKVSLHAGSRAEVELADVEAVVTRHKQARAFALAEALAERDLPRVLRCLDEEMWEMKFDKEKSGIGLLYGLISKFRMLIFMQEMLREGWVKPEGQYPRFKAQLDRVPRESFPADKRFNPLSAHPFMLFKALPQARRYTSAELVRAMGLLLDCNRRLVSSGLDDALLLQQTVVKIIQGNRERLVEKS